MRDATLEPKWLRITDHHLTRDKTKKHHCTVQHSPADGTSPKGSGRNLLYSGYLLAKGLTTAETPSNLRQS